MLAEAALLLCTVCPPSLGNGGHVGVTLARPASLASLIFAPALLFLSRQPMFAGISVSGCAVFLNTLQQLQSPRPIWTRTVPSKSRAEFLSSRLFMMLLLTSKTSDKMLGSKCICVQV